MKTATVSAFVALFLTAAAVKPASAIVLYDGGTPDHSGQLLAQLPASVFMNFTLDQDSILTDAHWWGGCFPAVACEGTNFQIGIWADDSGSPGTQLAFRQVGGAGQTATGEFIGPLPTPEQPDLYQWTEYAYDTSFTNVPLQAGEYWFSIQQTALLSEGGWGIEVDSAASAPLGQKFILCFDPNTCSDNYLQRAGFYLTGELDSNTVPLPAALPLFGTGLALLGFVGRRRKKTA